MALVLFLLIIFFAYLLGSIPTAFLVGRLRGIDIRKAGSGNSGATNALRVLGRGPAALVLAVDAGKGLLAVLAVPSLAAWLAYLLTSLLSGTTAGATALSLMESARLAGGTACILGHVFPVWLHFKGGKGVATGAAVVFALAPKAALVCLATFVLVAALGRYVSLASISAALLLPGAYAGLYRGEAFSFLVMGFCAAAAILVLAMHRRNIGRLLAGTEDRLGGSRDSACRDGDENV